MPQALPCKDSNVDIEYIWKRRLVVQVNMHLKDILKRLLAVAHYKVRKVMRDLDVNTGMEIGMLLNSASWSRLRSRNTERQ